MTTSKTIIGSIARIADFERRPPSFEARDRDAWSNGDYVVCEMLEGGLPAYSVETVSGDYEELRPGDRLIGALGRRAATLEAVGDWEAVGDDLVFDTLTAAGVLGRCTSAAVDVTPMAKVRYVGHAMRDGAPVTMRDVVGQVEERPLQAPVILIIGTSMNAGKTVSASAIICELKRMDLRVTGTKVTGVGRYRDILSMRAAGADHVLDFVDAGLPSTIVPAVEYERALAVLCSKLAETEPDVVVAEAGASPLEPYNAEIAVELLSENVKAIVVCASDPYAVVGVMEAFKVKPDLVSGRATSTKAAIALVEKLAGVPALNMLDATRTPELVAFLRDHLELD